MRRAWEKEAFHKNYEALYFTLEYSQPECHQLNELKWAQERTHIIMTDSICFGRKMEKR